MKRFKNLILKEKKSVWPQSVKPMLATLVDRPFNDKNWIFEVKWDGYRVIAKIKNGKAELLSRNGKNFTSRFAPIAAALVGYEVDVIFDGEVVVLDDGGRSNFQLLQNYLRTGQGNLVYYIFDILYWDQHSLKDLVLKKRKKILAQALPTSRLIRNSDWVEKDGKEFFAQAVAYGLEGVIGKRKDSIYMEGRRSTEWVKIKGSRYQDAVVGGFTEPRGGRKKIGSLILGVYEGKDLLYIGHTGTGFSELTLAAAYEKLKKIRRTTSPFRVQPKTNEKANWVEPKLVCEVKYTEFTDQGILRHPVFYRWRDDKKPRQVEREKEIRLAAGKYLEKNNSAITKKLKITNAKKIFWPAEKYTKADVIKYYNNIADYILPYLKDRPQNLNRHPNGITGKSFYHKNITSKPPRWVKTVKIYSDSNKKYVNYLICQDKPTLLYMANLGCIEINPWNSRTDRLDYPDYGTIDLDPNNIEMAATIKVALEIKKILDRIKVRGFLKTSGGRGLHIFIPFNRQYNYKEVAAFIKLICLFAYRRLPEITSLERSPEKRQGKIYLDCLQNSRGKTIVSAYCLRPKPGAPVSTPLNWGELKPNFDPKKFNIETIFPRLDKIGDLWKTIYESGADLGAAINLLEKLR